MADETFSARRFASLTRVRCNAGDAAPLRKLRPEDYPLVEIVTDDLLDGWWLYLHPDQHGTREVPKFVPRSHSSVLKRECSMLLNSYHARTTPPVTQPPAAVAYVYTATDHLAE